MLKIRNKVRLTKKTVKTMEGTFSLDGFGYISLIDWSSLLPIYAALSITASHAILFVATVGM